MREVTTCQYPTILQERSLYHRLTHLYHPWPWSATKSPNNLPSPQTAWIFRPFLLNLDLFASKYIELKIILWMFPHITSYDSSGKDPCHAPRSLSCQVQWESRQHGRQGDTLDGEKHLRTSMVPFFVSDPSRCGDQLKIRGPFFFVMLTYLGVGKDGSAKIQHLVLLGSFSLVATWPVEKSQVILFKLQTSSARGMCKLIHKHPQLLALHIYIYMYYVCMILYDYVCKLYNATNIFFLYH